MADEDPRFRDIEERLASARRSIAKLGDSSTIEQLLREDSELQHVASQSHRRGPPGADVSLSARTRTVCAECVSRRDLDTAFLTVLRYIESISHTKADSAELSERATRESMDARLGELVAANNRQMSECYQMLQRTVEDRVRRVADEFEAFARSIEARIAGSDARLNKVEGQIAKRMGRQPPERRVGAALDVFDPPKRLKFRTDGVAEVKRLVGTPEPSAKALMPAVVRTSPGVRGMKSLIPGAAPG
jgi:hypothetical protein